MRYLLIITLLLSLTSIGCTTAYSSTPNYIKSEQPIEKRINPKDLLILASVKVITDRGLGSGTIISEDTVLTCEHVINGANSISVLVPFSSRHIPMIAIVRGDMGFQDVAVLKIDHDRMQEQAFLGLGESETYKFTHIAPQSRELPKTGSKIYVAGYPLGRTFLLTAGYMGVRDGGFITSSANIIYGNSGGALVNEKFEIIGVIVRVALNRGQVISHMGYSVPLSTLDLLEPSEVNERTSIILENGFSLDFADIRNQ